MLSFVSVVAFFLFFCFFFFFLFFLGWRFFGSDDFFCGFLWLHEVLCSVYRRSIYIHVRIHMEVCSSTYIHIHTYIPNQRLFFDLLLRGFISVLAPAGEKTRKKLDFHPHLVTLQ
jgi:hypothetical protein